ncbi:DUF3102 domain-containing protein [Staphylococcus epidermidis]|uniref:DUF3102 domain-containing protein n=1 Tax=Staphylococcus epidermidis TaxID=1282 RepID=UPI001E33D785|nr:DUF3102 domain-containing protein [Staphylococcus epidermidis]MCD8869753.1 DUF3102 domain-containing protein [Staphylococcus epidermidis]MEB6250470.1 DUF3102 domain-containing protein [Staphylococcus epidermidis]
MNELQLSNDLTTIETEIKSYQNIAGQSIFEIGRRLKHVKENDLAHGEFGKWLEQIGIESSFARKSMQISKELSSNSSHVNNLGIRALYQIATIPEEQREEKHETSSGEMKTPYEMTNKEREEFKRQLKQRDEQNAQLQSQVEQAQRSEEIAKKQLEDAESREAEVVEKEIVKEVVPDRINKQLENLKNDKKLLEQREKELSDLKRRFKEREQQPETNKYERDSNLTEEEQIASIKFQVETNLLSLRDDANEFLNKVAHTPYREAAIARASDRTKNMMFDVVEEIEAWTRQMRNSLNTSQIIEGD